MRVTHRYYGWSNSPLRRPIGVAEQQVLGKPDCRRFTDTCANRKFASRHESSVSLVLEYELSNLGLRCTQGGPPFTDSVQQRAFVIDSCQTSRPPSLQLVIHYSACLQDFFQRCARFLPSDFKSA